MSYIETILSYFKKTKKGKPPLRDKHGRPYYLTNQRFWNRYPRTFIIGGGILSFLILYSAPLYSVFFRDHTKAGPYDTWWPHEIQRGKRDIDILRERIAAAGPDAKFSDLFAFYDPRTEGLNRKMKRIDELDAEEGASNSTK